MRTALVTGGTGFIGGHLCQRLVREGWRVVAVDDQRSSPVDLDTLVRDWDVDARHIRVEQRSAEGFFYWDVRDVEAVFHLAGPVGAAGVLPQAGTIVGQIVTLAETVRDWALYHACPLVYVATSESYGANGECHEDTDRKFPPGHTARQEYAIAKLAGETLLLNTKGLDVRIVRPFNVAGPRQSGYGGFATPRFIAQAMAGLPLSVHAPGTQMRAFTHVLDEVDGIYRAYTDGHRGLTVNLGRPGNRTTVAEFAQLVIDVVGGGSIEIVPPPWPQAVDKWPGYSQVAEEIGWEPTRTLRDIVADAYAYMRRPGMAEHLGCL